MNGNRKCAAVFIKWKWVAFYIFFSFYSPPFFGVTHGGQETELRSEEEGFQEVDTEAKKALESGMVSKAIELYEEFLISFPSSAEAMVYLGGIYGLKGDFKKEVELCSRAIQINPNFAMAHINLGNAQLGLEKWQDSEKAYLTGYKIAAKNKDVRSLRSASYALSNYYLASPKNDNLAALWWADVCIGHLPKALVDGKGLSHGFGNQFKYDNEELIWLYESATMNKAGAYANMKDFKSARSILEMYLKKFPLNVSVKEMLSSFEKYE